MPVTLSEIARLADHLGEARGAFFARALGPDLSPTFGLPLLAKRPDGLCALQSPDGKCLVHPVKPRLCRAFVCLDCPADAPPDEEALALIDWLSDSPEARATCDYLSRRRMAYDAEEFARAAGLDDPSPPSSPPPAQRG